MFAFLDTFSVPSFLLTVTPGLNFDSYLEIEIFFNNFEDFWKKFLNIIGLILLIFFEILVQCEKSRNFWWNFWKISRKY